MLLGGNTKRQQRARTHTHTQAHLLNTKEQPLKPGYIESTLRKTSKPCSGTLVYWKPNTFMWFQFWTKRSNFASGALYTQSCAFKVFMHRLWNSFYRRHSFLKTKRSSWWLRDPTRFKMEASKVFYFNHTILACASNGIRLEWEHKYKWMLLVNHFVFVFW